MNFNLMASLFQNLGEIFGTGEYIDMIITGLGVTLLISIGATIIGLILGTIVAIIKIIPSNSKLIKVLNVLCNIYTTVIRGTPMALQLFIMAFVIFAIRGFPMEITAILAFGINSGAYVSENIRAGILSVDKGQMEAGRGLGLSWGKTMWKIVIPQAIKNVITAIGNAIVALSTETTIVSMEGGLYDLTLAGK
ncbi:MAG: amino acid ABC transporter permease, partial [Clostridia bacterium]|nr:amino acid ABC transporter permease [Clostridia bacterium]